MPPTRLQAQEMIEVYQPELFRLAYSLTRSAPVAEKICDEALLAGLRRGKQAPRPDEQGESDLALWMARRVVSACRQHNWLGGVKETLKGVWSALREMDERDGPAEAGASYSAAGLWPAFLALPPAEQCAIALRYFHNYSLGSIAYILSTGESSVAGLLASARSRLDAAADGPHAMLGSFTAGLNHTQARQLMQSAIETPVKGPPWMALQAHLEACPACRAYRQRLDALTRDLGRALAPHLSPPQPARPDSAARLLADWEKTLK